jgi:hypothetical protein
MCHPIIAQFGICSCHTYRAPRLSSYIYCQSFVEHLLGCLPIFTASAVLLREHVTVLCVMHHILSNLFVVCVVLSCHKLDNSHLVKAKEESMKKSSSSSSSSSSPSSSSSFSDETEDLANRLTKTNSTPTTPSPKNLATLDKLSGSDLDSASHQGPGHDLGFRGGSHTLEDLSGGAGALPKDPGPGV